MFIAEFYLSRICRIYVIYLAYKYFFEKHELNSSVANN